MKNKIIIASVISVAAVLIAVAVLLLIFIPNSFAERMEKADKKLAKKPYVMEVDLSFECYDDEIKGIFAQLENRNTTVYVDGDRFRAENTLEISVNESGVKNTYLFENNYTVIGGTLYSEVAYTINGEGGDPSRNYASVSEQESRDFLNGICLIGGVSAERFAVMTDGKDDGSHVAVFTGVSDEDRVVLEEMMLHQLSDAAEGASLKSAQLTVQIEDGKYDCATLKAEYDVTISGKIYAVSATVELEFDYDDDVKIYLPDKVNEYQKNDLENIIE